MRTRADSPRPASVKRAEVFHGEAWGAPGLNRRQLPGNVYSLPHQVGLLLQSRNLGPVGKMERMRQARHIQLPRAVFVGKRAISHHVDAHRREASAANRFGDQNGVKGFSGLREDDPFAFHQIYVSMSNAIQALKGVLRPFGSKPSYHTVDFNRSLLHLRSDGYGRQKTSQPQEKHRRFLLHVPIHRKSSCKTSTMLHELQV
jgi:hypothetical protein